MMTEGLSGILSIDLSAYLMCLGLEGRLEIIKEVYISKIGDKQSSYDNELSQKYLVENIIRELSDIYNVLIDVNAIFHFGIFWSFFNGTVILCCGFVQFLLDPYGNAICIIPIYYTELFLFCYFGQRLAQKHVQLSTSIYSSQWYNLRNIQTKKTFLFLLMRTQGNVGLKIGAFGLVTMELFTDVSNKVYGVATFVINYLLD